MTLDQNLLTGISNISRLCMLSSKPNFEVNMSLYPTKFELNIYIYKGGYLHAWRNPKKRIQKIQIKLNDAKKAAVEMLMAYSEIEKMAKGAL